MPAELPMMPKRAPRDPDAGVASAPRSSRVFSALATIWRTSSLSNGLVTKSNAPLFKASTAVSIVPCAVISTTGSSGSSSRARLSSVIPSTLGILRSVMTRSIWCSPSSCRPRSPSSAVNTSYPSRESCADRILRRLTSSSTMRTCFRSGSIAPLSAEPLAEEFLQTDHRLGEAFDALGQLVVGHAVGFVHLPERGLVDRDSLDLHRRGLGRIELARELRLALGELVEERGGDGEQVATGELRDL